MKPQLSCICLKKSTSLGKDLHSLHSPTAGSSCLYCTCLLLLVLLSPLAGAACVDKAVLCLPAFRRFIIIIFIFIFIVGLLFINLFNILLTQRDRCTLILDLALRRVSISVSTTVYVAVVASALQ